MQEIQRSIPVRNINCIQNILLKIERNGGYVTRSAILTRDEIDIKYSDFPPEQALTVIARLKNIQDSLETVLQCVNEGIETLQPRASSAALEVGILKLPDDILALIFQGAYNSLARFNKNRFSLRVSQVSRRFRKVALETPQIWTYLRNTHTRSILELCIQRSGCSRLTIDIDESHMDEYRIQSVPALRHFLTMVTPLSHRWSKLRCRLAYPESGTMSNVIVNELARYGRLDLPALTELDYMDASQRPDDSNTSLFFFSHPMINVTHYFGEHVVPRVNLASRLLSLELHLSFWDRSHKAHRLRDLTLFLQKATSLTSLSLDFHSFNALPAEVIQCAGQGVSLPNLSLLHIKLNNTSSTFLESFIRLLKYPALTSLKLQWGTQLTIEEDISDFLSNLFEDEAEFLHLQELRIMIQNQAIQLDHVPSSIFHLPSLRHLSIRPVRISWNKQKDADTSPLQTLSLLDCQGYNRSQITEVLSLLRKGAYWDKFERLKVESSYPLTEPFLEDLKRMVDGKLEWCL